jgi:hypothetical protein
MVNVLFLVMAGFETPHYVEEVRLRKLQFQKHGVHHKFLFDSVPETYTPDENDLIFPKLDPIPELHEKMGLRDLHPFMIQKFVRALQTIDLSPYDFIVRVNISTYIHIENFMKFCEGLPKKSLAAANRFKLEDIELLGYNRHTNPFTLFSGTCILMSKDIGEKLRVLHMHSMAFYAHNDDVALTYYLDKYAKVKINIPMYWCDATDQPCPEWAMQQYAIIRIKHYTNPEVDIRQWKRCLSYIDKIESS